MSGIKLTWKDLMIQDAPEEVGRGCLECWPKLVRGRVGIRFFSRFGDCFFCREDGSIDKLSVLAGEVTRISTSDEALGALVNSRSWQEEHLHSLDVLALHQRDVIAAGLQCYALVPHPAVSGTFSIAGAMVMDLPVWHHLCAQLTQ